MNSEIRKVGISGNRKKRLHIGRFFDNHYIDNRAILLPLGAHRLNLFRERPAAAVMLDPRGLIAGCASAAGFDKRW